MRAGKGWREWDSSGIAIALRSSLNKCAKRDLSMNTKFQSAYKSTHENQWGIWGDKSGRGHTLGALAKTCEMQRWGKRGMAMG